MTAPTWEPLDLDLEIPEAVWSQILRDVEEWNQRTFPGKDPWVSLTPEEAVGALDHFGFRPLVRVREERMAITISDPERGEVLFALTDHLPEHVHRVAGEVLEITRVLAKEAVNRVTEPLAPEAFRVGRRR